MKRLITLTILFSVVTYYAQETIVKDNSSRSSSSNYSNKITYYNVNEGDVIILNDDTVGSPYLFDEFKIGSIYIYDEISVSNIAIKYNAYNDVFYIKPKLNSPKEEAQGVTKSQGLKIKLGPKTFISLPSMNNRLELQYYELLADGEKGKLLKKNGKIYKEKIEATTSLTKDVPATFKDQIIYYFQHANGDYSELPTSKKKLLAVFEKDKKSLSDHIKKNKLNIKKERDLIKLFKFYNEL